eukprot:364455-Chlamydomonas_euryale.AAC.3
MARRFIILGGTDPNTHRGTTLDGTEPMARRYTAPGGDNLRTRRCTARGGADLTARRCTAGDGADLAARCCVAQESTDTTRHRQDAAKQSKRDPGKVLAPGGTDQGGTAQGGRSTRGLTCPRLSQVSGLALASVRSPALPSPLSEARPCPHLCQKPGLALASVTSLASSSPQPQVWRLDRPCERRQTSDRAKGGACSMRAIPGGQAQQQSGT